VCLAPELRRAGGGVVVIDPNRRRHRLGLDPVLGGLATREECVERSRARRGVQCRQPLGRQFVVVVLGGGFLSGPFLPLHGGGGEESLNALLAFFELMQPCELD
jgi:hypothetical protein